MRRALVFLAASLLAPPASAGGLFTRLFPPFDHGVPEPRPLPERIAHLGALIYVPDDERAGSHLAAARAWVAQNPAGRTDLAKLIAEHDAFAADKRQLWRADLAWASRDAIVRRLRVELGVSDDALFERVMAAPLAALEVLVADQWGVGSTYVGDMLEHALPGGSARPPLTLWDSLTDPSLAARPILYGGPHLHNLLAWIARVSPDLERYIRRTPPRRPTREALARVLGANAYDGSAPRRFRFADEPEGAKPLSSKYRGALERSAKFRDRLRGLPQSPDRDALVEEVEAVRDELIDEVATLPVRLSASDELRGVALDRNAWWSLGGGEEPRTKWAHALRARGLASVGDLLLPPPERPCRSYLEEKEEVRKAREYYRHNPRMLW